MLLPHSERVMYHKNPLKEVVCQLRFERILGIEIDLPATFQRKLGNDYGSFDLRRNLVLGALASTGQAPHEETVFDFSTIDKKWRVSLSGGFVALTCSEYRKWDDFRDRLKHVRTVLTECYGVSRFTRLGLRYIDVIKRGELGLQDVPWRKLLKPHIAGMLVYEHLQDTDIREAQTTLELLLETGRATIRHGLGITLNSPETVYFIDADFYTNDSISTDETAVFDQLNAFNRNAGNLFRWCIEDALHRAMDPRPID